MSFKIEYLNEHLLEEKLTNAVCSFFVVESTQDIKGITKSDLETQLAFYKLSV
jgi:hypothetical protein